MDTLDKRLEGQKIMRVRPTINVVGNHVWDYYWDIDTIDRTYKMEPSEYAYKIARSISVSDAGIITFDNDIAIALPYQGSLAYFYPKSRTLTLDKRYDSHIDKGILPKKGWLVPVFQRIAPGGGAAHSTFAIDEVCCFDMQYVGPAYQGDIGFGLHLNALGINNVLYPYLDNFQANIVISKIRFKNSKGNVTEINDKRTVIRGPEFSGHYNGNDLGLRRGTILMNSFKDEDLGKKIIDEAKKYGDLGIICCTKSTPGGLREYAIQKGFVPIFDDADLTDYTGVKTREGKTLDYQKCAEALMKVRKQQQENGFTTRIYLTMGKEGSMCLDEDGQLYRMNSYYTNWVISVNGAGDSFAAGVAILEHMSRYEMRHIVNPLLTLQFGAAMSTSKIARGCVEYQMVDSLLRKNHIRYAPSYNIGWLIETGSANELLKVNALLDTKAHTSIRDTLGVYARA